MKISITGINEFVGINFTNSWCRSHTIYEVDIRKSAKEGMRKTLDSFR